MSWIRRETEKETVQYICPHCHDYHEFREDFGERTFRENYIFCRRCGARNGTGNAPTLTPPNEPLTLKQLREINGQPVWVEEINHWALIDIETGGRWSGIPFVVWAENGAKFCYNIEARNLHCYRCMPLPEPPEVSE